MEMPYIPSAVFAGVRSSFADMNEMGHRRRLRSQTIILVSEEKKKRNNPAEIPDQGHKLRMNFV